jgi:hypothetical protein
MEDNDDTSNDGLRYSFRKGLEFGTRYKRSGWGGRINNPYLYDEYCDIMPSQK